MNIESLRKKKNRKRKSRGQIGTQGAEGGDTEFEEISFDTVEKGEATRTPR